MVSVLFDGLAYGMLLFLMAVGLSITMGLMNFVNLAHGVFAMVGGYVAILAMNGAGLGFGVALLLAFAAAAAAGAIMEILFFRRLFTAHALDQVLVTVGVVFVAVAVATYFFGPTMQLFQPPEYLEGRWRLAGFEVPRYRLFLIVAGLLVLGGLGLILNRTRLGAMVRATVDNRRVAQGTGIDVQRLFFLVFSFACGIAGLGGALSLGMLSLEPSYPLKYMVEFLIVVSVGGAGTIIGPFVAALMVGLVDVAGKYYLPETGTFLVYVVMIVGLLLRPYGLVPRPGLVVWR
ncbi:MAG: branched-chain amino acid ABC transporter permease [Acidobacteria bacterium]|nr:branched-chain amino acid ABC transporter permease [Acidobacteriota bacterium]MEB2350037.1 branched-chain amino acid ABC transporter permease [Burkholderiaceae bacterium]